MNATTKQFLFFGALAGVGWYLFLRKPAAKSMSNVAGAASPFNRPPPLVAAPQMDETNDMGTQIVGAGLTVAGDVAQADDFSGGGYLGAGAASGAYQALKEAGFEMNPIDESESRLI